MLYLIKEYIKIIKKIFTNPKEIVEQWKQEEQMKKEILEENYKKIKENKK